jgi:PAS domain S-box-containing protein
MAPAADSMYRAFFEQATHFAALLDLPGNIVEINRVSLALGGYAREHVIGRPLRKCRWWDYSDELVATARAAVLAAEQGATERRVLPYRALDDSERCAEVVVAPVSAADGRVLFLSATGVDVTERRRVTQRLRLPDGIGEATRIALDPKAIMAEATRLLGEHLGVTRVAYADVECDNDRFTIRHDWHVEGVTSTVGTYSLDLFGSRATSNLRVGSTLLVSGVDRDLAADDGAAMFNAIGIKAVVCCPLVKGGRLMAMMGGTSALRAPGRRTRWRWSKPRSSAAGPTSNGCGGARRCARPGSTNTCSSRRCRSRCTPCSRIAAPPGSPHCDGLTGRSITRGRTGLPAARHEAC